MKTKAFIGSILAFLLMVGSASALPLIMGLNTFNDTSGETLINNAGGLTTVDAGDALVGDIIINQINVASYSPQLTAHFDVKVASVSLNSTTGKYDYVFEADTTTGFGAMAWFYIDSTTPASFATPSTFQDGSLWASFGINPANSNNYWTASLSSNDLGAVEAFLSNNPSGSYSDGSLYASYGMGLDVITNNTGLTFLDVGTSGSQLVGTGHLIALTGTIDQSAYSIGDQANLNINVVPEPASLLLLGVGLLCGAFVVRRRICL